jgi:hypothetical protein
MVSGIMFCFSEWRLELRLCPATTLSRGGELETITFAVLRKKKKEN